MLGVVLGLGLTGAHAQSAPAVPAAVADIGLGNTEYGGLVTAEVFGFCVVGCHFNHCIEVLSDIICGEVFDTCY